MGCAQTMPAELAVDMTQVGYEGLVLAGMKGLSSGYLKTLALHPKMR